MRGCAPVFGLFLFVATAPADQVNLGASRDNTLYEDPDGGLSNGAGMHFFIGQTALDQTRRAVIAFDVAGAVPPGSTIDSVSLTLHMSMTIAAQQPATLHRLLADWGEGTSDAPGGEGAGGPATDGDCTWKHTFFPSELWSTLGGDFDGTPSGSTLVGDVGFWTWSSTPEMVADVQGWLDDPSSNFGWLIAGNEGEFPSAKRFDSRQHFDPTVRPVLTIDFTPPPPCDPCDMNCDGSVNASDIQGFIERLFDDADPCCGSRGEPGHSGDTNGDGAVNASDIQGFIACLFG